MSETMEQKEVESKKIEVVVPFNNEVLVRARRKTKIASAIIMLFCAAVLAVICIPASNSKEGPWLIWFLIALVAFLALAALFLLLTIKPNPKDENKKIVCNFYEGYLQIYKDNGDSFNNKKKVIKTCLYRKYPGKQFVAKVIETNDKFQIKIFTGTYNGIPQYESHMIPKSVFNNDTELNSLKSFLEQKVSPNYIVK